MAAMANKKRPAPVDDGSGEESSVFESTRSPSTQSRQKKARFQTPDDDDETSVFARSTAPSLADTNTATATIAETDTPHTDASSARSKSRPRPKKYQCTFPDCTKAFDRPIRLQTHINSHTGERPHACPHDDCDKRFQKPEHLNRHVKEKHGNQTFTCTHKVRKDDTGIIEECGRVFESSTKLKRHIAVHEEKEETTCTWEGCGKVFRKQDTLQRHIKKDHLNEDSYICKRETADGDVCGQAFPTPGQLRGHEAKDHQASKYICQICTTAMDPPTGEMAPIDNGLDAAFLPTLEDLQYVGHDFDPKALGNLSLEDNARAGFQHPGGIVCFPTYHDLQRHLKFVHPPVCDQCGKKCKSGKDLAAHIDIHHSVNGPSTRTPAEKKFLCPVEDCPRAVAGNGFTKKGNLDVHVKSAHTKEKKFICGEYDLSKDKKVEGWDGQGCGMALGAKQSLIGHVRTQHLNLPPTTTAKATKRKTKSKVKQEDEDEDFMETDDASGATSKALSMLTGFGYEQHRPYACLMAAGPTFCQMRFAKEYELCSHLELTHGWNVDDISEAMGLQADEFDEEMADDSLRRELEEHVGGFNAAGREAQMFEGEVGRV
ncbi:hypothetical protein M409DRAFT_70386 [Zasmidium cellare ATCC 36951]|uniref:C2H2-type domain-containing protein n=1 Tax=Zasmidium cellare ATCC 36951 TaxID=1080233 RepID=A0A6A6C3U9_ZASCE|nr:uncharacterized protein M409DRAFT_70386 [Zasmidium cellare ATCC 36951]KAF2160419.1 hypothetical protein M409DRAFT_70386 [Zasmidium cellare ATCC 36951]